MNLKKGITMVALIATIVILLLLAGVSLSFVIGPKSLTSKAIEGRLDNRYSMLVDEVKLRENKLFIEEYQDKDRQTAEEFVEKLIDEDLLILTEDAYEDDFSAIYIGASSKGTFNFKAKKYKYKIDIVEP